MGWALALLLAALFLGLWSALRSRFLSGMLRGRRADARPAARAADLPHLVFALYNQPSAYHGDFWEHLDLALCEKDFALLRQDGFNGIAVGIPFGSFVPRVTPAGVEFSQAHRDRLIGLLTRARRFQLTTVLWFNMHRLPEGISGTAVTDFVDPAGVRHAAFTGYFPDEACVKFFGDYRWQAYLAFCRAVADAAQGFAVVFDPLDWQNFEPYVFQYGNPHLAEGWRRYLEAIDPDLAYWRARWSEALERWDQVLPPISEAMLEQLRQMKSHSEYSIRTDLKAEEAYQAYRLQPLTKPDSPKWEDFAGWRDHLLNEIYGDITGAVRARQAALIGQRLDLEKRYGRARAGTWGAAPNIDVLFYPLEFPLSDAERTHAEIAALGKRAGKPVVLWEVTLTAPQSRQALWGRAQAHAHAWGYGAGLWCWRDSYFNYYTDRDNGLRGVDNTLKRDAVDYDFLSEFPHAAVDPPDVKFDTPAGKGAFLSQAHCGAVTRPALFTVAPSRLTYSVPNIAPGAQLRFQVALVSAVGDGAEARILVETPAGASVVYRQYLRPAPESACRWTAGTVPLDAFRGQSVRVTFAADGGPARDLTGDWIAWATPVLTR